MKKRNLSESRAVAFHEAGHAFAHHLLRLRPKLVTIVPEGDAGGYAEGSHRPILNLECVVTGTTNKEAARWHDHLVSLYAGECAQQRHNPRSVRDYHASSDRDYAWEIITRLYGDRDTGRAASKFLKLQARDLVNHPMNWKCIEAIASALLDRKTLKAKEVREVISKVA